MTWQNLGNTPAYRSRRLTYRLVGNGTSTRFTSEADIREWLPGEPILTTERLELPPGLSPGLYTLEVGLPGEAGRAPETTPLPPIQLAMDGRTSEGFYPLSTVELR